MKILVADDEDLVRNVVVRLLHFLGHEIVEAETGAAALSCLQEQDDIDLALLDEQMPGLRGTEVLQKLREFSPTLPVLLSSGNNDLTTLDEFTKVLSKPYRLDTLEAALASLSNLENS